MRYGVTANNALERGLMAVGMLPTAMTEGYAPAYARAVVVATERGMFDAIGRASRSAEAVAAACGTDARATEKLLNFLATMGYLKVGKGGYRLARHTRRFLLADAPGSIRDAVLMKRLEWRWIEQLDTYLADGRSLDVHQTMSSADWALYQRGMRAQANLLAPLLTRLIPMPRGARLMLDIGGSHGYFSVSLCRRYPGLRAVVLELPDAVEHAAPILAREKMGDRVVHRVGDALSDDLGEAEYDLVFMFSLVHHFDDATNRQLLARAARVLRPGGVMVIGDLMRPVSPGKGGQSAAFFDLYFALTSQSGLWTSDEIRSWQLDAGLVPRKPIRLPFAREVGLQVADRP
jgi:predicted O-methyltransferase YrrM